MARIWGWAEVMLHDKAVDLHRAGYASTDIMGVWSRLNCSYETAVKICGLMREMEGRV